MSLDTASDQPVVREDLDAVFSHFDQYDWSNDAEFHSGVVGIMDAQRAQGTSEEDVAATVNRAKAFYFSTKVSIPFSYEEYLEWKAQQPAPDPPDSEQQHSQDSQQGERYPPSFDAIVELISTGRTDEIPGIRDIPLKINEEPPTSAVLPKRPKPWESESPGASPPS